jgi:hypothetical protein
VVGSIERPMSDADLEATFLGLAGGELSERQARTLMARCWDVEALRSASDLATAAHPDGA